MTSLSIKINNASISYTGIPVFSINLKIPIGKWTGIIGPSGIGKSTFLSSIAGLTPSNGVFSGCIEASSGNLQEQITYIPQSCCLLPWLTVIENILIGTKLRNEKRMKRNLLRQRALALLQEIGLAEATYLYPHQLSGGMKQRVSLVRAFLEDKPIVLMDESFSSLDIKLRHQLQDLAATLLKNKTVIFITHDPSEALRLAHYIYLMHGKPAQLTQVFASDAPVPRDRTDACVQVNQANLFNLLLNLHDE